jgi:hypothetical protein
MAALPSAAIITVIDATENRLKMMKGMSTANQMSAPPMVGVPSLVLWPSGPSSRMFWPNSLSRSQRMNGGPMTSIRIMATTLAPMALSIVAPLGRGARGCRGDVVRGGGPGGGERLCDALQTQEP